MNALSLTPDLDLTLEGGYLVLQGELHRDNAEILVTWLTQVGVVTLLDLSEFDILDGVAAAEAVNAVRQLLMATPRLCIDGAPQVLAHNLYRSGMLGEGRIDLIAMREDEAYG